MAEIVDYQKAYKEGVNLAAGEVLQSHRDVSTPILSSSE